MQKNNSHQIDDGDNSTQLKKIIILIHGIRTKAEWQYRISKTLAKENEIEVVSIGYGYLDVFQFWFPFFTRRAFVKRVLKKIRGVQAEYRGRTDKISVLAHSFGTYAISKILEDESDIVFEELVLCGSIISSNYDWTRFGRQVRGKIVNDCSRLDIWPAIAQSVSWGYGATGTIGFKAARVSDRFHPFKHSDYFDRQFVIKYWQIFFHTGQIESRKEKQIHGASPSYFVIFDFPLKYVIVAALFFVSAVAFPASRDFITSQFSNEFQIHKGYRVLGPYDQTLLSVDWEICVAACVDSASCRAFTYSIPTNTCHLSSGYNGITADDRGFQSGLHRTLPQPE